MHLLETGSYKILVDCGLDYERETRLEENEFFPFNPSEIDVVLLTHAHIDHSGNLPTLVRMGFEGQVLCTPPTADLTELLLFDSVNIFLSRQQRSRSRKKRSSSDFRPLYLQKHVQETVSRFVTIGFNKPFQLNGSVSVTFIPAGHLLGAASIVLTVNEQGIEKKIAFTGDLGRKNYPVIIDPEALPQVDYLVCESTYGGRSHSTDKTIEETLVEVIADSCVKTPGRLIIPAFSIGRTQALVYSLNRIFEKRLLPKIKVFVDSPLANYATDVFKKYRQQLREDARYFYQPDEDAEFENLSYVQNLEDSREISNFFEPCIIVSSAGMLEGGRIQDHLYNNIHNYYCTILFIGYCAKGTLGNRLLRGDPVVKLRNRELSVYAAIKQTDLFSGHADHNGLVYFVKQQDAEKLKQIFLVHGEPHSMDALSESLGEDGYKVSIPEQGQVFEL